MELKEFLKGNVLAVASVGDTDACTSFVLLRELARTLNPKARMEFAFSSALNKEGAKILKMFNFQVKLIEDIPLEDFPKLILLDTQTNNIPDYLKKKEIFVIDHHEKACELPKGSILDSNSTSTAEILLGLFKKYKLKLTDKTARAVLFGIIADTSGLRFAKTETFRNVLEILDEFKFEYQKISSELFEEKDISERIAWLKTARRLEFRQVHEKLIAISEIGAFESSSASKLIGLGADVALVVSKKPDEVRIIGRARHGINLAEIFIAVGKELKGTGGGHAGACVMNLQEGKEKEAIKRVISELEKVI
ncbi:MAG: DHHA1 domain-containing protein [Nanoarchaeota archaeon]